MTSLKEKQVDKVLDRIIGSGDETLRVITKLALMNNEITPELVETIEMIKKQNEEDAKALHEEMEMTLDMSGNLVPVETYVPPIPLTFTIENGVINNLNGNIDVVYRLPVGKT